ncbi:MAG: hypothetical protein M3O86_01720 [Actinomycetota bacterium]|nr:hypothetical protein [Actinomycetota bacterium]
MSVTVCLGESANDDDLDDRPELPVAFDVEVSELRPPCRVLWGRLASDGPSGPLSSLNGVAPGCPPTEPCADRAFRRAAVRRALSLLAESVLDHEEVQ